MGAEPGCVDMSPSVIVQVSNVMYSTSIFGLVYYVSRTVVLFFTYGNFFFGFVKLLVVSYSGGVFTMHLHSHCILVFYVGREDTHRCGVTMLFLLFNLV